MSFVSFYLSLVLVLAGFPIFVKFFACEMCFFLGCTSLDSVERTRFDFSASAVGLFFQAGKLLRPKEYVTSG